MTERFRHNAVQCSSWYPPGPTLSGTLFAVDVLASALALPSRRIPVTPVGAGVIGVVGGCPVAAAPVAIVPLHGLTVAHMPPVVPSFMLPPKRRAGVVTIRIMTRWRTMPKTQRTMMSATVGYPVTGDLMAAFPIRPRVADLVTTLPVAVMMIGSEMVALPVTCARFVQPPVTGKRRTGSNQNKCRGKKPYQYGLLFHGVPSLFRSFDRTGAWSAACRPHGCLRFDPGHLTLQDAAAGLKVDTVVDGGCHQRQGLPVMTLARRGFRIR